MKTLTTKFHQASDVNSNRLQTEISRRLLALLLFVAAAHAAHAQSFSINWSKTAGGGSTSPGNSAHSSSIGGTFVVSGTIGQPDASGPLSGGTYTLVGGFWAL